MLHMNERIFNRPFVYFCSPLRSASLERKAINMAMALTNCDILSCVSGKYHIAPHAFLPVICDDEIPEQRQAALDFGKMLITHSQSIYVAGEYLSEGMLGEIGAAIGLGRPVHFGSRYLLKSFKTLCPAFAVKVNPPDGECDFPIKEARDLYYECGNAGSLALMAMDMAERCLKDAESIIHPHALQKVFETALAARGVVV